jgi:AcrR family transcriptional regulator
MQYYCVKPSIQYRSIGPARWGSGGPGHATRTSGRPTSLPCVTDTPPRRARRDPNQLRQLLLASARELFDKNGYQATTTAEIARHAGVSERVLFNQFGSKAALFDAAVVEPFVRLLTSYVDEWVRDTTDATPEQRLDRLIQGLFKLARQHRTALLTVLAENGAGQPGGTQLLDQLARALQRLEKINPSPAYRDEYRGLDMPAVASNTVGMIFGVALLDSLIFPTGSRRPSHKRLTEEMRKLLLDGMRHRP